MGNKKIQGISQFMRLIPLVAALFAGCDGQKQQVEEGQSSLANDALVQQQNAAASSKQQAMDSHPGKMLHDANCISCHDAGKYQSAARRVSDFPALLAQVRRCDANLSPRLTDDDIAQITDYLNQAFYGYDKL